MQATSVVGIGGHGNAHPRPSLVGANGRAGASRVPRLSQAFSGTSGFNFAAEAPGSKRMSIVGGEEKRTSIGLTDKEIDERVRLSSDLFASDTYFITQIAKAVEREVKRRMEEHERARAAEEEERRAKEQLSEIEEKVSSREDERSQPMLPSGVMTPLLKRHQDLDDELKARLQELEQKLWVVSTRE